MENSGACGFSGDSKGDFDSYGTKSFVSYEGTKSLISLIGDLGKSPALPRDATSLAMLLIDFVTLSSPCVCVCWSILI